MPQDYIKYKNKKLDGRFKILPDQYPEIIAKYKIIKSIRKLAKEYEVDKGTILMIVNPQYKKRHQQYQQGRWKFYYDRKKHANYIKKYRDKKRKLKLIKTRKEENNPKIDMESTAKSYKYN